MTADQRERTETGPNPSALDSTLYTSVHTYIEINQLNLLLSILRERERILALFNYLLGIFFFFFLQFKQRKEDIYIYFFSKKKRVLSLDYEIGSFFNSA